MPLCILSSFVITYKLFKPTEFKYCIIVYLTQSVLNSYCTLSLPYGRTSLRLTRAESFHNIFHSIKLNIEDFVRDYKLFTNVTPETAENGLTNS